MKKFLLTSLLFVSAYILSAQSSTSAQSNASYDFTIDTQAVGQKQAIVITGYRGGSVRIIIPEYINNTPVMIIGDNAFRSKQIESVVLPATLVRIGDYAFYDNKLTSVNIPVGVTVIGRCAFDNNNLKTPVSAASTKTTYERTVVMAPTHSETVYAPAAVKQALITVAPGYNPVGGQSSVRVAPSSSPIVSVHEGLMVPVAGPTTYTYYYSTPSYTAPTYSTQSHSYSYSYSTQPSQSYYTQGDRPQPTQGYYQNQPSGQVYTQPVPTTPSMAENSYSYGSNTLSNSNSPYAQQFSSPRVVPGYDLTSTPGASLNIVPEVPYEFDTERNLGPSVDITKRGFTPVWSQLTPQ